MTWERESLPIMLSDYRQPDALTSRILLLKLRMRRHSFTSTSEHKNHYQTTVTSYNRILHDSTRPGIISSAHQYTINTKQASIIGRGFQKSLQNTKVSTKHHTKLRSPLFSLHQYFGSGETIQHDRIKTYQSMWTFIPSLLFNKKMQCSELLWQSCNGTSILQYPS